MTNDDINILFASCVAAVILIADFIATYRKQRQLISSDVPDVVEEKKEQIID
jgi:hypothetical protein